MNVKDFAEVKEISIHDLIVEVDVRLPIPVSYTHLIPANYIIRYRSIAAFTAMRIRCGYTVLFPVRPVPVNLPASKNGSEISSSEW